MYSGLARLTDRLDLLLVTSLLYKFGTAVYIYTDAQAICREVFSQISTDISSGRVYISRDVVFDETIFPFDDFHPNAGQQLRSELLLLQSTLFNSPANALGDMENNLPSSTNATYPIPELASVQDSEAPLSNFDVDTSPNGVQVNVHAGVQ